MKIQRLFLFFLFTTFTIIGCGNKNAGEAPKNENNTAANTNSIDTKTIKAPDFVLAGTNGSKIKLSDYRGKVVILDFWATWCPPCRKGIPDLIDLQKNYKNDLVVIGISVDTDTKNDVIPFIKEYGINYHIAYADNEVVQNYGNIQAIPTSFIIDRDGNIVTSFVGLQRKEAYSDLINKLIKKS